MYNFWSHRFYRFSVFWTFFSGKWIVLIKEVGICVLMAVDKGATYLLFRRRGCTERRFRCLDVSIISADRCKLHLCLIFYFFSHWLIKSGHHTWFHMCDYDAPVICCLYWQILWTAMLALLGNWGFVERWLGGSVREYHANFAGSSSKPHIQFLFIWLGGLKQ